MTLSEDDLAIVNQHVFPLLAQLKTLTFKFVASGKWTFFG